MLKIFKTNTTDKQIKKAKKNNNRFLDRIKHSIDG